MSRALSWLAALAAGLLVVAGWGGPSHAFGAGEWGGAVGPSHGVGSSHGSTDRAIGRTGCGWRSPVDAPVTDPFRAPPRPFGPGNRGIEYGTVRGQTVVAVDAGRVVFSGPVAGRRWLVIGHTGGLRSTYGPLADTTVVRGQSVGAGQLIGRAEPRLHLTARTAGRYLDPGPLLAGRCWRARLVAPSRRPGPGGGAPGPGIH